MFNENNNDGRSRESNERHRPCSQLKALTWLISALLTIFVLGSGLLVQENGRLHADQAIMKREMKKLEEDIVTGRVATAEIRQQYAHIRASLDRIEQKLYPTH